jgi:hypothetical protein
MPDKKDIDENELDKLLNGLFLEETGKTVNEDAAQFIFSQEYDVTADPGKEKELLQKLGKGRKGFGGYKLYLSVIAVVILTSVLFYYVKKQKALNTKNNISQKISETDIPGSSQSIVPDEMQPVSIKVKKSRDTFGREIYIVPILKIDSLKTSPAEITEKSIQNTEPELPFVTEPDKLRYKKIKNLMLQKLYDRDKTLYTHIEADQMSYCNKTFTTSAFNMRIMGITNLEYKTFLADLLVQNRKQDYEAAKVFSEKWITNGYNELVKDYFRDEKYNDFPVVNITIEGAKLFCKWQEEEIKVYMKQNKLKFKPLRVRLPFDYEWLYAARAGYVKIAFEENYNTIFDLSEGLVDESFVNRTKKITKQVKRKDSLYSLISINHYGWSEKDLIELFNKGLKYYNPFPGDTIHSERMRIYGKTAHVSEIIEEKRSAQIWLIGASWKDKTDYLKLQNEFKTAGASPFVGFRPVVINGNDQVYMNPFP